MSFKGRFTVLGSVMTKKRGFTLVEVFIVAMLTGMVLMTILSAFVGGLRIWKAAKDSKILVDRKFHISIVKIEKELKGYIRDFDEIYFEGDDKEVSFPSLSGLDIVKVTYLFDKGRKTLLRKEIKHSDSLKDEMNEEINSLFSADNVEFSYLFSESTAEDDIRDWVTVFSEEDDIVPSAVRLNIKRNGKEFNKDVFINQ